MSTAWQNRARRVGRTVNVGRIPVAVSPVWAVVVVLLAAGYYSAFSAWGHAWAASVIGAFVAALALVASLLIHELAHAVLARRLGLGARGVTLGGFSAFTAMEREPTTPRQQALVAGAGPLASLVIAAIAGGLALSLPAGSVAASVLGIVAVSNLVLGAVNLLPGFPLDGGALLSAAVWAKRHDRLRGRVAAATGGRRLGITMMVASVFLAFTPVGFSFWLFIIGLFTNFGARRELRRIQREQLRGRSESAADFLSALFGGFGPDGGGASGFGGAAPRQRADVIDVHVVDDPALDPRR